MKKLFFIVFLLMFSSLSYAQPSIHFDTLEHDFGIVKQQDNPQYVFEFSNNGDQELLIEKLKAS